MVIKEILRQVLISDIHFSCHPFSFCDIYFRLIPQITRDYDEEEQGYDSDKEREYRKDSDDSAFSPHSQGNGRAMSSKQTKVNGGDDHHDDMDVSD